MASPPWVERDARCLDFVSCSEGWIVGREGEVIVKQGGEFGALSRKQKDSLDIIGLHEVGHDGLTLLLSCLCRDVLLRSLND